MAKDTQDVSRNQWAYGNLHALDDLPNGDSRVGQALHEYAHQIDVNRQALHWRRVAGWIENILFGMGRQYIKDLLVSRISRDSGDNLSLQAEVAKDIPNPVNDLLGNYIEPNIGLLTENRPRPRVTPKSDAREDQIASELSELTLEYLWEKLDLPEKHREMARLMLYCGVTWLEVVYDPMIPRYMKVPKTEEVPGLTVPGPGGRPITLPVKRQVPVLDEKGRAVFLDEDGVQYGDVTASMISPFEMHLPPTHEWNGPKMGWILREWYAPLEYLHDFYGGDKKLKGAYKKNGWYLENLPRVGDYNVQNLPLWWWERLTEMIEGSGNSLYMGTPDQWSGHTVVRVFDRRPNPKWLKGRTIITAGDQVLYDSPPEIGARAYNARWPNRWHPYIRYRWEGMPGSVYGRSLVSKLLPKLKRINSIDATAIMWRRTVPMGSWILPKGSHVVEDFFSGMPGSVFEYDPRRTMRQEPKPIYPPGFPSAILEERATQIAEMEAIAGTQEILRGQRPVGTTSAAMLDLLRKQALASRSPILQSWDESLQATGTALLQETIKHVRDDASYLERIRILAREKVSRMSIEKFSGEDLSDNVIVRVDTASMTLQSKEAKAARTVEFLQFATNLTQLPLTLQQQVLDGLGFTASLDPQGPDTTRAKAMISWIKQNRFDIVKVFPEDNPYVFHELLVNEIKSEAFLDLSPEQQNVFIQMVELYRREVELLQKQEIEMQIRMAQLQQGAVPGGKGE